MNERLYTDYCNLYDGLFLSSFRTTKPQTEEALHEFIKVYLDLKSPQWYLGKDGPCYRGPSITISDETVPITEIQYINVTNTRFKKLKKKNDLFDLSRSNLDVPVSVEFLKMMIGNHKFVSRKKVLKTQTLETETEFMAPNVKGAYEKYLTEERQLDLKLYFPTSEADFAIDITPSGAEKTKGKSPSKRPRTNRGSP